MVYVMRPTVCEGGSTNMTRQVYSMTVDNMRTCQLVDIPTPTLGFVRESYMTTLYYDAYVINL